MIDAYDWPDAETRAKKLGIQLNGEHIMTLPVCFGWAAKALVAIRNFFFR